MPFKPLPIGVDNFEKLILGGYYYVDKTGLIKELLDSKGEVNLFTRPRRTHSRPRRHFHTHGLLLSALVYRQFLCGNPECDLWHDFWYKRNRNLSELKASVGGIKSYAIRRISQPKLQSFQ